MKLELKPGKELLFHARIDAIRFKHICELTPVEAQLDGFQTSEEAVEKILEINHTRESRRWCYIVQFHRVKYTGTKRLKGLSFTHFRNKLVRGEKQQTVRMIYMPPFVEEEIIKIVYKHWGWQNFWFSLMNFICTEYRHLYRDDTPQKSLEVYF